MGIVLILLGLASAAVVADLIVETDFAMETAGYSLFGGTFEWSERQVVIGAAVMGALAVLFIGTGFRLLRGSWDRSRSRKQRIRGLELENEELRSKTRAAQVAGARRSDTSDTPVPPSPLPRPTDKERAGSTS